MLVSVVVLLLALFVFPFLAFPLLLLGILFLLQLYLALKGESDVVEWSRAFNAFAYFALDLLFATVFLLTNFVPFYIGFALFLAISIMILNKFSGPIAGGSSASR